MAVATAKWFNAWKGNGVIQPDARQRHQFVQLRAVWRSGPCALQEGQTISCEIAAARRAGTSSAACLRPA